MSGEEVRRPAPRGVPLVDQQSGLPQPFSYTDESIKNLVYKHDSQPWTLTVRYLIRENLRRFIAQHTLSEFLANVSPIENINLSQDRGSPSGDSQFTKDGDAQAEATVVQSASPDEEFVPRDEITNLFYDFTQRFAKKARRLGVELQWIGLGTWITPSEIIPEQHLEAWKLSCENQLLGNDAELRRVRQKNRNKELLRLIRDAPITNFGRYLSEGLEPEKITQELLLTYREKLRNAWEIYQNSERTPPQDLEAALKHLTRLTARWLV